MILTLLSGYPDFIGYRQAFAGYGNGPASYVTGGDPLHLSNPRLAIDAVFGAASLSGNYFVMAVPAGVGSRQSWNLIWLNAAGGQVTPGTNLSAEQVQLGGFCGQF